MAITYPVMFTPIDDLEAEGSRPTADELARKLAQNLNLLHKLAPIGSMIAVHVNQAGAAHPDPTLYQLSDGSAVVDANSPLLGDNTPNTFGKYIRGANASTNSGNEAGGTATLNLNHDHGGNSANFTDATKVTDGGVFPDPAHFVFATSHSHALAADLSGAEPLDVAHIQIAMYLKIG